jgi:hypothetical protein
MKLIAPSPYPHASFIWRDWSSSLYEVFVMSANFDIGTNADVYLASAQSGPRRKIEYYGEPGRSSVRTETDLVPHKKSGEFYLVDAVAVPPEGVPREEWTTSVSLGSLHHEVSVCGPRNWHRNGRHSWKLGPRNSTTHVDLRYEMAFGGSFEVNGSKQSHRMNPVGRGFAALCKDVELDVCNAHQIDAVTTQSALPVDYAVLKPAGFTPVDRGWSPRAELLGTVNEDWIQNRWPLVPKDFEHSYFACSPEAMRLPEGAFFAGNEQFRLCGIQTNGWKSFLLPDSEKYVIVVFPREREPFARRLNLDTVVINTGKSTVDLTWRTSIPLLDLEAPAFVAPESFVRALKDSAPRSLQYA